MIRLRRCQICAAIRLYAWVVVQFDAHEH